MPTFNDFLALSVVVYQDLPQQQVPVPTADPTVSNKWERLTIRSDSLTGYFGAAYFNNRTKEVVLVNRGTELSLPEFFQDVDDDVQMVLGQVPEQFRSAESFYTEVVDLIGSGGRLQGFTLSITRSQFGVTIPIWGQA